MRATRGTAAGRQIARRSAFTLIELLVVIAVIAVLVAILSPSLGRAKDRLKQMICASNMRQLGIAWVSYAHANNGMICGGSTYRPQGISGQPWDWVVQYADYGSWNLRTADPAAAGALYAYAKTSELYRCTNPIVPSYPISYSMVGAMHGQTISCQGCGLASTYTRLNAIKHPSEALAFVEEFDARGMNCGSFVIESHDHWSDYLAGNHNRGDNLIFADSHAEYWKWEDASTLELQQVYATDHAYHGNAALYVPDSRDLDRFWKVYCGFDPDLPLWGGLGP
jgi:prepilin-type N-terminal cleavage/methylation domain-containing protein